MWRQYEQLLESWGLCAAMSPATEIERCACYASFSATASSPPHSPPYSRSAVTSKSKTRVTTQCLLSNKVANMSTTLTEAGTRTLSFPQHCAIYCQMGGDKMPQNDRKLQVADTLALYTWIAPLEHGISQLSQRPSCNHSYVLPITEGTESPVTEVCE